jgi:hypothetical protein
MKNYFLLILLSISTLVYGDWSQVTFNDETTMSIDPQTIKRKGDLVQVSQLMNFPLGSKSPDGKLSYKSSITTEEYDCKKGLSRTLSFRWYSDVKGTGKMVYEDKHTYEYTKLVDGSLLNSVRKKVCEK